LLKKLLVYLYGSKEDYNRWAELVGDVTWDWEHTREIYKQVFYSGKFTLAWLRANSKSDGKFP
jgi:hypothetical protein